MSPKTFNIVLLIFLLVITGAILIPKFIGKKNNTQVHSKEEYDRMYHELDSIKQECDNLKKEKEQLDKVINSLQSALNENQNNTKKTKERKNESLRVILNNTPTELDSFMSTIDIKAHGN